MIEGDNLEVLKLLQKSYAGKVKLIYIDPPFNTGKDFVYPDDFRDGVKNYLELTGQLDDSGRHVASNSERSGRFHSTWLSMIYPRLMAARALLAEDGVIFVSIDDGEVERLRSVMSEIFGEENLVAQIAWQNLDTTKNDAPLFSDNHEYLVGFAKRIAELSIAGLEKGDKQRATYKNRDDDPRGDYLLTPLHAKSGTEAGRYTHTFSNGQTWTPPPGTYPRFSKATLERLDQEGRLFLDPLGVKAPQRKTYWVEVGNRMPPPTFWDYRTFGSTRQSNAELSVARRWDDTGVVRGLVGNGAHLPC